MNSDNHLVKWDINSVRQWRPYYFLDKKGRICPEPNPPFEVRISVEFDDNDAAMMFEGKVRDILQEMSGGV
jgi:hypothetical protein